MTVRELELIHVHRFVRQMSRRCSRLTMKSVVDFIRGFLRFQFLKGALHQPLHTRITIQAAGGTRWKTSEDLLAWLESQ